MLVLAPSIPAVIQSWETRYVSGHRLRWKLPAAGWELNPKLYTWQSTSTLPFAHKHSKGFWCPLHTSWFLAPVPRENPPHRETWHIFNPSAFHPVIKPTFTSAQWVWEHTMMPELLLWHNRPCPFTCCFSLGNVWTSLGIKTPIWNSGWASLLLAYSYCVGSVCTSDLITYSCSYTKKNS